MIGLELLRDIVEEIMADLAWFSVLLVLFCSSPGILRQPQHLAREREVPFLYMYALWFSS